MKPVSTPQHRRHGGWRAIVGLVALGLLLWCGWCEAGELLPGTAEELEALSSLDAGKLIRAREQAEAILEDGPSFIATYVRAYAYYEEEANHPRALFLMRKAEDMLLDAYGKEPSDPEAIRWHKRILNDLLWIYGEMDLRQEQLDVIDRHDEHYAPSMDVEKIWPMMKQGRFDEAAEIGREHIYSDDFYVRLRAYNGLMAIADEKRDRAEAYRWGKEGVEKTQQKSCVVADNMARSSLQMMQFEEAEDYIKIARQAENQDCSSNPYTQLTALYLLQGEFQKCISTFEALRKEPPEPRLRVQFEMYLKSRFVELLYALGQFEEAQQRAEAVVTAPDRLGLTSASPENQQISNSVLYWTVLQARREQERERASARSFFDGLWRRLESTEMALGQWEKSRMTIQLGAQQNLLVTMVRPYYLDVMPWYVGTLNDLLGPGIVRKAVAEARLADADFAETPLFGYFDALEAEALWRAGEDAEAQVLADRALERLPVQARLLRWRTQAWLGVSLWESGQRDAAEAHLHEVLTHDPTALRHLRLALPVVLEGDASDLGNRVVTRLAGSPRLHLEQSPFLVQVETDGDVISICLRSDGGQQYACVEGWDTGPDAEPPPASESERIAAAIDRFHDKAFAPRVELTQSDINTLDGRTGRIEADEAVEGIVGGFK